MLCCAAWVLLCAMLLWCTEYVRKRLDGKLSNAHHTVACAKESVGKAGSRRGRQVRTVGGLASRLS